MKKFFIDSVIGKDKSVEIVEFSSLPDELFQKEVAINSEVGVCSILDTETTGLDFKSDEIIEIAIRQWLYHKKEHILIKPLKEYCQLNEPQNKKISKEITELTGITQDEVSGKKKKCLH